MKRGTPDHPKMLMLMQRLQLSKCAAVGVVEMLWQVAARYAANGDISRYPRPVIVSAMGYDGDPDELFESLIACGWVDRLDDDVEYIHDWHEHAEDATHLHLARRTQLFANGQVPSLKRLGREERDNIEAAFTSMRTACAQKAHKKRTADADADSLADAYAEADMRAGACEWSQDETTEHAEHTESAGVGSASVNGASSGESAAAILRRMGLTESHAPEWCKQMARRIQLQSRDGPAYGVWWLKVCALMAKHGLEEELEDGIRYVEQCGDERTRKVKDLGPLKQPGRYLAARCRDALKPKGVKLPKPPAGATV